MTASCDPYIDESGCMVTPECPGVPAVPSRMEDRVVLDWNAGANSIDELDGDLHVVFTMPHGTMAAVVGLRGGRGNQTRPEMIEHGLFFQSAADVDMVQVLERGTPKTDLVVRGEADVFEIRRARGEVTYWLGATLLHASARLSGGRKVVNACLYGSGDGL